MSKISKEDSIHCFTSLQNTDIMEHKQLLIAIKEQVSGKHNIGDLFKREGVVFLC